MTLTLSVGLASVRLPVQIQQHFFKIVVFFSNREIVDPNSAAIFNFVVLFKFVNYFRKQLLERQNFAF